MMEQKLTLSGGSTHVTSKPSAQARKKMELFTHLLLMAMKYPRQLMNKLFTWKPRVVNFICLEKCSHHKFILVTLYCVR